MRSDGGVGGEDTDCNGSARRRPKIAASFPPLDASPSAPSTDALERDSPYALPTAAGTANDVSRALDLLDRYHR